MTRSVEIPEQAVVAFSDAYLLELLSRVDTASLPSHAAVRAGMAAALPYLVPAEPVDTRTEEEKGFVEIALNAADAGNAGHWPTVAGYLADEVRRLRAEPAGDGGLREALEQQVESWKETSDRSLHNAADDVQDFILDKYPAAPAVPQPVDREAVEQALLRVWLGRIEDQVADSPEGHCAALADAVLAVLAGEQEQAQ